MSAAIELDDEILAFLHRAAADAAGSAPAHDILHVLRVVGNAREIAVAEDARVDVVVPAALLHELFNYPKDHPQAHESGDVCAERADVVLQQARIPEQLIEPILYCIRVHPFSRGIVPTTLEAKVLQDADRLDAVGAVGIARCFATCSEMGRPFYNPTDPFCARRPPDDKLWGIDHFYRKLLLISDGLHTATARRLPADRVEFMREFLTQFAAELGG